MEFYKETPITVRNAKHGAKFCLTRCKKSKFIMIGVSQKNKNIYVCIDVDSKDLLYGVVKLHGSSFITPVVSI